jgi:hypothetical protein
MMKFPRLARAYFALRWWFLAEDTVTLGMAWRAAGTFVDVFTGDGAGIARGYSRKALPQ